MVPMVVYVVVGGSWALSVSTTSTVAVLTGSTLLAAGVAASGGRPGARPRHADAARRCDPAHSTRCCWVGAVDPQHLRGDAHRPQGRGRAHGGGGRAPEAAGGRGRPVGDAFVGEVRGIVEDLEEISWVTVGLWVATIAVMLGVRRFAPRSRARSSPSSSGSCSSPDLDRRARGGADRAGAVGPPRAGGTGARHVGGLLGGAFAIAIMCFLETASVAGSVRRPEEPPIDNDQELAANGVSCVAGAMFRAMPSAGGFSQTAINQRSGAVTQLSELVTALLAVACALFLGGVLSDLPQATLGCMVVVAVAGLIRPAELRRFWHLDRVEFWVAVVTAASGLLFGLLPAVLVGVLLTLLLVLRELDRVGVTELRPTPGGDDVRAAGQGTVPVAGLLVLRLDGPLYTANVRGAHRRMLAAVDAAGPDCSCSTPPPTGWCRSP